VLIRRCAWHREFQGYPAVHGIASWRGLRVKFTDGVCRRCAARVRVEWRVARVAASAPAGPRPVAGVYRHLALVAGVAALVAAIVPASLVTDTFRGDPERPAAEGEPIDLGRFALAQVPAPAEPERAVAPPRAPSRHRRPAPPRLSVIRYRPSPATRAPERPATAAATPLPARPVEAKPSEPARSPVRPAAAPAGVARVRAAEDDLARVAHRHSAARPQLAPPVDRARPAGLALQTP
jgi:hypothetical protein